MRFGRRYIAVLLSEEEVIRWHYGLWRVGFFIAREKARHRLHGWPELKHATQIDSGEWRLIFVWPEQLVSDWLT